MKKAAFIFFLILMVCLPMRAQRDNLAVLIDLSRRAKGYYEGYAGSSGKNEFSYHSFRSDLQQCMISRCTDGTMDMEWYTQEIPATITPEGVGFIWIAAIDITEKHLGFSLYVNDSKRLEYYSGNQKQWTVKSSDGGSLTFQLVTTDMYGDAHGYMVLQAPASWLIPGKAQKIRIVGEKAGGSTWTIVFKTSDVRESLAESVRFDTWLEIQANSFSGVYTIEIKAPLTKTGESLRFSSHALEGSVLLQPGSGQAFGSFQIPLSASGKRFVLWDSYDKLIDLEHFGETDETSLLLSRSVLENVTVTIGGIIFIKATRTYKPKLVESLLSLSQSPLARGSIYLMNSSHQDIAWMDSPEKCVIERDTMLLTPLLTKAAANPGYRFDIEDALMLKEYMARHPESTGAIRQMLTDGRLSCGASFVQPYEEMYSGESLIRQFYMGARWLKKEFGYNANTYWNLDVPGRTLQMPQIMRKSGVTNLMLSRQEKGFYRWFAPDGSEVLAFSPGHYSNAYPSLHKDFYDAACYLSGSTLAWAGYLGDSIHSPVVPVLSDWDMSPAEDYSFLISQWERIDRLELAPGKEVSAQMPVFHISTAPEFFQAFSMNMANFPILCGERPAVWLYIHGPSHQQAIKASREGDILLPMAEKFATIGCLLDGSFATYPEKELEEAWESKIFPDHGWGGKHGDITDALFLRKYLDARAKADALLTRSLEHIASYVRTKEGANIAVVVFNSLSQEREDPVSVGVTFDKGKIFDFELIDQAGKKVDMQVNDMQKYDDNSIRSAIIEFIAAKVPSVGYRTFYVRPLTIKTGTGTEKRQADMVENPFYTLCFGKGGLTGIYDKQLGKELVVPGKFLAGEIFTMRSIGNGAGEFADIQKPDMDGFDKTSNQAGDWVQVEKGPVYSCWKFRCPIRYAVVEEEVRLYHKVKRIDFLVNILNWEGVLYREFRMALPLAMTGGEIQYEVPFGVVRVGKDEIKGAAGERYITPCKDVHPRGIENWIGASDKQMGVVLSSSVAVADWIDPTNDPVPNIILQPILLASRRSCHGEGNEYLQTGYHHFQFSLTSYDPMAGIPLTFGREVNEQLVAVIAPEPFRRANLPEASSFFSTGSANLVISTIKKQEEGDDIVVRMFEERGEDSHGVLQSYFPLLSAGKSNLLEEGNLSVPMVKGTIPLDVGHNAIETFTLKIKK
jgi:alpha-mannosidase